MNPCSPQRPTDAATMALRTRDVAETRNIGCIIGQLAVSGTLIALFGDLGSGKTALIQGLARGMEVDPDYYITSPTFTLINEYPGRLPLYHVDLYRLDGIDEIEALGLEETLAASGVTAVEWAERLGSGLPQQRFEIHIGFTKPGERNLCLAAYGPSALNLLKEIQKKRGESI